MTRSHAVCFGSASKTCMGRGVGSKVIVTVIVLGVLESDVMVIIMVIVLGVLKGGVFLCVRVGGNQNRFEWVGLRNWIRFFV